jgi:branched-chain amino acid transport system substrate-binding protein
MIRRRFLGGALATAAALPASPARAQLGNIPSTTVTLGVAGPFNGKDRPLGEQLYNGVQQAVNDANQIHGTFDLLFSTRIFDDQDLLAQATVTAQEAVDDITVACVIGHLNGHVTEATLSTYNVARLPVIVPTSSYDRLTEYGYGGVLRMVTKDTTEGSLGAKYFEDRLKPKQVAVLYQDGDYGFDVANGFATRLGADKVACTAVKISWEKPQFDVAVQQALAVTPDLVYLAGNLGDMGAVLDGLRTANYAGTIGASQGFFTQVALDQHAKSAEGMIASSSIPPFQFAPTVLQIIQNFEQNFGPFTAVSAFGYAAAQVAIDAVRRTGQATRQGLWQTFQIPGSYATITGSLSFFSTGDQVDPNLYFYQIKDGKWTYIHAAHAAGFLVK